MKKVTSERKRDHYFGYQVWSTFSAARTMINNHLNSKYIPAEELRSGEIPAALIDAIRNYTRHVEADAKADTFLLNKKSRLTRQSASPQLDEVAVKQAKFNEIIVATADNWFPPYWLAFTTLSLPAGRRCLRVFDTMATRRVIEEVYVPVTESARQPMSRLERRRHDRIALTERVRATARGVSPNFSDDSTVRTATPGSFRHAVTITTAGSGDDSQTKRAREEECLKSSRVQTLDQQFQATNRLLEFYVAQESEAMISVCRRKLDSIATRLLEVDSEVVEPVNQEL